MRLAWMIGVVSVGIALSATGAQAQRVIKGNDTGGIIPWSCDNEEHALELAANHCAWFNKYPRITSVHRQYGDFIGFNCLWRPNMGPYQLPRVAASANACSRVPIQRTRRMYEKYDPAPRPSQRTGGEEYNSLIRGENIMRDSDD